MLTLFLLTTVSAVTVNINRDSPRTPVNPDAFAVNGAPLSIGIPWTATRFGGNAASAYNYILDSSNSGLDYYFLTVCRDDPSGSCTAPAPNPTTQDSDIASALAAGAKPLVTAPMMEWIAKTRPKSWSYDWTLYPGQSAKDPWSNAGSGQRWLEPQHVLEFMPWLDANRNAAHTPVTEAWVGNWITHLRATHGNGAVKFFSLDNEPHLWDSTHYSVHPTPTTYDELWEKTVRYASVIKQTEPQAMIFGPVTWGWCDLWWSAADNCGQNPTDRAAHGNVPFLEWYVTQLNTYWINNGVKLVDYLDVHYYPAQSLNSDVTQDDARIFQLKNYMILIMFLLVGLPNQSR